MTEQPINILYVDDYPLDRELVRDTLEKEDGGFQIIEAASRAEFETRLAEGGYDLVLSDFNILGFEGLQVIDAVRAEKSPLPVVILTGTGSEEVAVEAMKRGADDYVIKNPHHIRRLPLTLRAVLDRQRTEETLKEQYSTLHSIIDSVDALIFSVDRHYCYTSFNQGHAAVMKALYGAEIEIGRSLLDYMTVAEDRETARGNLDRALAGEQFVEETFSGEKLYSQRYFQISHNPIKNETGQVIGVAVLAQDITERKRAEKALQESENRYRRITEGLTDYQYSVRVEDGCAVETTQSQACETVTGYTPEEFAADPHLWFQMIAPEDREPVQERIQQILAGKETPPLEHRLIRKDGAVRWVRDTIILFKDASGKLLGYNGVIKDITDRKRAEEEIRKLNQELEQRVLERTAQLEATNKELEAFAYSVSHDLRAPLRHIDGFLELLQESLTAPLNEHSRRYMTNIADAVRRMGTLIDDLLSFSRMGRYELSKTSVDLSILVQEIIRELAPETQDRTINWHIAALPTISGDRAMLRQALVNLLANALKFTRGCVQADIEIGCRAGEKETIIFIRDNGVGFDMAYADKLFGVFQRLHPTEEFEGTGIGLANVRRIINRHGGRTWAEGQVKQGATFYFSLPHTIQEIK